MADSKISGIGKPIKSKSKHIIQRDKNLMKKDL
jgi:hypothetical protein